MLDMYSNNGIRHFYETVTPIISQITESIAVEKGVSIEQLLGKCRVRKVVEARSVPIYRIVEPELYIKAD